VLRLNEDAFDVWESLLDALFQRGHVVLNLGRRQSVSEIEADIQKDVMRSEMHGQQFVQPIDIRVLGNDPLDLGDDDTTRALAGEKPFAFVGQVSR